MVMNIQKKNDMKNGKGEIFYIKNMKHLKESLKNNIDKMVKV